MLKDDRLLNEYNWFNTCKRGIKVHQEQNIVNFLDKPLLGHVADSAKKSKLLSHIICSTDDKKIMKVCDSFDIEVQVRPHSLSQDDTNIVDVIKFVIEKLSKDNVKAEIIVLYSQLILL